MDSFFHIAFIGPGGPEFLVIMLVLLVMFGAKDAPRILRKLNEIINQVRNTADSFKREVMYGDIHNETPSYTPPDGEDDGHDDDYDYGEEDYYDEDYDANSDDTFDEMEKDLEGAKAEAEAAGEEAPPLPEATEEDEADDDRKD